MEFEPAPIAASPMVMPTPASLLDAFRRRFRLILAVGPVLAALVALTVWYIIPPAKYVSKALLTVQSATPVLLFKTGENRVDWATYKSTQLTLLKSREILGKAINPDNRNKTNWTEQASKLPVIQREVDPISWLEKRIQADFAGETLRIWMTGEQPDDLKILVNAVADSYIYNVLNSEDRVRQERRDTLEKKWHALQDTLKAKRETVKPRTQLFGGTKEKQTIQLARELAMERQSEVRRELIRAQTELKNARAEYKVLLDQAKQGEDLAIAQPDAMTKQFIIGDQELQRLKARKDYAEKELIKVSRVVKDPSDAAYRFRRDEQVASKKAFEDRMAALQGEALERFKVGGPGEENEQLRALRVQILVLEEKEKVTQAMYNEQAQELADIREASVYIEDTLDEIENKANAAKVIGDELAKLEIEEAAPKRIAGFEEADAPRREDDRRVPMAGMAGLGTFGLFVLGIALLEFRTQRISSIDEVSRVVGLRVVGALPVNRDRGQNSRQGRRETSPYGGSLMAESIDSIRTMILHATGDHPIRSLMITSATSGEGKTSLACHLAMSLARSGMKTLLIDCDLRKPTIHRLFDIPASPGFCEFLRGEAGADEIVRATAVDGLDAITAGRCDSQALRALARAETGAIFDAFADSHDIIVVDTSPVLPVTDPLLVGRHVDGAVYSILRDVSRVPLTLSAVGRIKSMNIRLLGAVVTGVNSPLYGTYYSGYGGYGGYGNKIAEGEGEVQHA
jgi:capsular exopolysaccharide synthesis family protein